MTKRGLIALILWWCEGTKLRKDKRWKDAVIYATELTNTNPTIIKIFTEFLTDELKIPVSKLKGQIQIHEGDNQEECEQFWSEYLGIPLKQFNKTIIRPKGNRFRNHHGTFKLRTYGQEVYKTLQSLLDAELQEIKELSVK